MQLKSKGGRRKGAGRKPAPYKTKTISFRVRDEWIEEITMLVRSKVAELKESGMKTV